MRATLFLLVLLVLSFGKVSGQSTVPLLEPIALENANSLAEVAVLGRGTANALDWHPDGNVLAVGSSTGVWLLDENLDLIGDTPITQYISKLVWSPDGSQIAVVSNARGRCTIQVWDAEFTEALIDLDVCGGEALWNEDGRYVAVFDIRDSQYFGGVRITNEVQLIDTITGEVSILPGQDGVWSPDGDVLFTRLAHSRTYGDTPTLYSWDVETREVVAELEFPQDYQWNEILWAVDDHTMTLLCRDYDEQSDYVTYSLCLMDALTGEVTVSREIYSYPLGQRTPPDKFAWNSDETYLASIVENSTRGFFNYVLVIDEENQLNIGDGFAFDWKPDTDTLTAIVGNGELRTYNARMREVLAQSQWFTAPINDIDSRPNSDEIASTGFGYEQNTYVWDMNDSSVEPVLSFYAEPAQIVDYTPDGSELIAGGRIDTDIVVNLSIDAFDSDTGERLRNIDAFYDQGTSPPRRYWNSTYTEFIEVDSDGVLTLPNGITIDPVTIGTLDLIREYVYWSPDETIIATVDRYSQDYSFYIHTWDVVTGESINFYQSGMFAFRGLSWSPDGNQIAVSLEHPTGSNVYLRGLRIFSVKAGFNYEFDNNDYATFVDANIYETEQQVRTMWNSDGSMLAVMIGDEIQIHDINGDGEPLVSLPAYDIVDIVWSSDDRFIAGGSADGTIRVWGVSTHG